MQNRIDKSCALRCCIHKVAAARALLGGLPLALGVGAGSELRRPLGIAIVGGLLLSQILTLYTTPVVYIYMSRIARLARPSRRLHRPTISGAVGAHPQPRRGEAE